MPSEATLKYLREMEAKKPVAPIGIGARVAPTVPPVSTRQSLGIDKAIDFLDSSKPGKQGGWEVDAGPLHLDLGVLPKRALQTAGNVVDSAELAVSAGKNIYQGTPEEGSYLGESVKLARGLVDTAETVLLPGFNVAMSAFQDTFPDQAKVVMDLMLSGAEFVGKNTPLVNNLRDEVPENMRQYFDLLLTDLIFELPAGKIATAGVKSVVGKLGKNTPTVDTPKIPETPKVDFLNKQTQQVDTILRQEVNAPVPEIKPEIKPFDTPQQVVGDMTQNIDTTKQVDIPQKKAEPVTIPERKIATTEDLATPFDKNNPGHLYFQKVAEGLEPKLTKKIGDGDFIVTKKGESGEVRTTDDGKVYINTPKILTKKDSFWSEIEVKPEDIHRVYKYKDAPDTAFPTKTDTWEGLDATLQSFVDTAKKTDTSAKKFDLQNYKKAKIEQLGKMSDQDLIRYIASKKESLSYGSEGLSQMDKAISKYDYEISKREMKRRLDIKRYKEGLGTIDIIKAVNRKELTKGQGLKIFLDNKKRQWKSVFSSETLMATDYSVKKLIPAMGRRLQRATVNKFSRLQRALEPFETLKEGRKERIERQNRKENILFSKWRKKGETRENNFKTWVYQNANEGVEMLTAPQRKIIDDAYVMAHNYGLQFGYRKNYIPQAIADVDGLLSFLRKKEPDILADIEGMIRDIEKKNGKPFTDLERANFINEILQQNTTSHLNNKSAYFSQSQRRKITEMQSDLAPFYHNPYDSIQIYLDDLYSSIELMETLGYGPKTHNFKSVAEITQTDVIKSGGSANIISWIDEAVINGDITPQVGKKLEEILVTRFADPAPRNRFERKMPFYKTLLVAFSLANPISALSNIKDLGTSFYCNGFLNTMEGLAKSISPKKLREKFDMAIKMEDLGLEVLDIDNRYKHGYIERFTNRVMKISFFNVADRLGKEVYLNASYNKRKQRAEKGDSRYSKNIEGRTLEHDLKTKYSMTDAEIATFKSDISQGKLTDDVKYVIMTDIARVQPIHKSAIPANYSKTITGRMFYTFKLFLVKKFDFYRSEFFDVEHKSVSEYVRRGARVIRYATMMMAMGMAVDEIKDWILNRKTAVRDQLASNLLELTGFSKYSYYVFKESTALGDIMRYREMEQKYLERGKKFTDKQASDKSVLENIRGVGKGLWSVFGVPATPFTTAVDEYISYKDAQKKGVAYDFSQSYAVSRLPVLGKTYYWLFGQGAERTAKQEEKRSHTPGFENRTIRELINPNINLDGEHMYYTKVARVVDGDTLDFKLTARDRFNAMSRMDLISGETPKRMRYDEELGYHARVRFFGVDTPESVKVGNAVQYFAKEASDYSKKNLEGKMVMIKGDYMAGLVDNGGERLVGQINTIDEASAFLYNIPYLRNALTYEDFNKRLVQLGYGKVTGSFPYSQMELYYNIQEAVQARGEGVRDRDAEKMYNILHDVPLDQQQTTYKYDPKTKQANTYVPAKRANYTAK